MVELEQFPSKNNVRFVNMDEFMDFFFLLIKKKNSNQLTLNTLLLLNTAKLF